MDRRKAFQIAAPVLALCAVILSLLPNGMGMVFLGETSPIQYIVSPCPILSLTAVGYGMPLHCVHTYMPQDHSQHPQPDQN